MRREAQIPLFLWIASALVVHAFFGGGAVEVAERIEETLDIKSFAAQVRNQARYAGKPVEVSFFDEEDEEPSVPPLDPEEDQQDHPDHDPDDTQFPEKDEDKKTTPEEEKKAEAQKAAEQKPEEKKEETTPAEKPPEQQQQIVDNRRVAVKQEVEDKNQEDNPDAEFAGDEANHVDEQTRATITASDGEASKQTLGAAPPNGPDPGNSENQKLAQSDNSKGRDDVAPGDTGSDSAKEAQSKAAAANAAQAAQQPAVAQKSEPAAAPPASGQTAREAQANQEAQEANPETMASEQGSWAVARAQQAQAQTRGQNARKALPGKSTANSSGIIGLGAHGTNERGVNLNLSYQSAHAIVGADAMEKLRKRDGERRLSEHRGGWQSMGLDKWRPALENYVASVQPGNQTALNTARVPFATYLNAIHQRLHEIFAHRFLGHLDQLPKDHPLNNMDMSTHLEVALSPEDGSVVRMGITKSSGVTAFDVGALDSVQRASPYGVPPSSIVSSDGNVYLHWEFHRQPMYACSTYFARPFILDMGQKSAPPRVTPPPPANYEEKKPATNDNKSGSIQRESKQHNKG